MLAVDIQIKKITTRETNFQVSARSPFSLNCLFFCLLNFGFARELPLVFHGNGYRWIHIHRELIRQVHLALSVALGGQHLRGRCAVEPGTVSSHWPDRHHRICNVAPTISRPNRSRIGHFGTGIARRSRQFIAFAGNTCATCHHTGSTS